MIKIDELKKCVKLFWLDLARIQQRSNVSNSTLQSES